MHLRSGSPAKHVASVLDAVFVGKAVVADRLARTESALNTTALMSGESALASVVLPAPGKPGKCR